LKISAILLAISSENAEFQIIQALKLTRSKRNEMHEIFIEGTECIKQAIDANLEITRIIAKEASALSDWAKNVVKANEQAKFIGMSPELYTLLCG
jgi:TrmH family RNA methyltransferase